MPFGLHPIELTVPTIGSRRLTTSAIVLIKLDWMISDMWGTDLHGQLPRVLLASKEKLTGC